MSSPLDEALDPHTTPARLAELAVLDSQTWSSILAHPSCYPDLAAWIHSRVAEQATVSPAPLEVRPARSSNKRGRNAALIISAGVLAVAAVAGVLIWSSVPHPPSFEDACPIEDDELASIVAAPVYEQNTSDLTERGTYGPNVRRIECRFSITSGPDEVSSTGSRVHFESIDALGGDIEDQFFDVEGGLDDGTRTSRPEWGDLAWVQGESDGIATFEYEGRYWRMEYTVADGGDGDHGTATSIIDFILG